MIGETLSHYRIVARLGAGGMGEVYRARDPRLERDVALKVLSSSLAEDPSYLRRFDREAKAVAAINHPSIVTIHSIEEEDGVRFLTMELVEGTRLDQAIPDEGMELRRLLAIAVSLADALAAAHERGVIHRDLKPGNIMLADDGQVKILDFGLAKLGSRPASVEKARTEPLTRTGAFLGTTPYMSPEQLRGSTIDHRSDIFSLGVVLYQMATGRRPFAGDGPMQIISAILEDDPVDARELRAGLPARLNRILRCCLAKQPADRYSSARHLLEELRRVQATDPNRRRRPVRSPKRPITRRPWWIAAAVVLALSGYLGWHALAPRQPAVQAASAQTLIAVLPFNVRGRTDYEYLEEGLVDLLAAKLEGAGEIRTVDPNALLSYVQRTADAALDSAAARRVADHFAASFYVLGEIVEVAGRLHISAGLYRRDSDLPVSRAFVEGAADAIFKLVDDLVAELVSEQISGPGAQFARTAARTTDSLPALKAYLKGEALLRAGQFSGALETLRRAVTEDPDFAIAWYRMSVAAEWAALPVLVDAAMAEAVQRSERLSPLHRSLLEARQAARRSQAERAERLYREIVRSHPTEVEAWVQLAEVQSHHGHVTGRSMVEARAAWERVIELEPAYVGAYWHLARIAALEQSLAEVTQLVDTVLRLNPEGERSIELLALRAFALRDPEQQQVVVSRLDDVADHVVALACWNVAISGDRFEVRSMLKALTRRDRPPVARAVGHAARGYLFLAEGRWREAQRELDAAISADIARGLEFAGLAHALPFAPAGEARIDDIRRRIRALRPAEVEPSSNASSYFAAHDRIHRQLRTYLLGLLASVLGDDEALERAAELESSGGEGHSSTGVLAANMAASIRAHWWRGHAQPGPALAELEAIDLSAFSYQEAFSSPFLSFSFDRFARAELLIETGRPEEALRWLAVFGETSYFDEVFVAAAQLRRAQALEALGRNDEAIVGYREFTALWSGCDPELRGWLREAEAGIERLSG